MSVLGSIAASPFVSRRRSALAPFVPKTLVCIREGYGREFLFNDLLAGLTVGVIAVPLAIAFAIASHVRPEQGLYTAIVAGFLISLLGGSRVQIGGPPARLPSSSRAWSISLDMTASCWRC